MSEMGQAEWTKTRSHLAINLVAPELDPGLTLLVVACWTWERAPGSFPSGCTNTLDRDVARDVGPKKDVPCWA